MKKNNKENNPFEITGPAIDMPFGIQRMNGNEAMAKEMLQLLVETLPNELKSFQTAYEQRDWQVIKNLAHKLHGATCYCGVPRLKQACTHLETYLQTPERNQREELYQQLLKEIETLQTTYKVTNF